MGADIGYSEARFVFPVGQDGQSATFATIIPLLPALTPYQAGNPCALLRLDEFSFHPAPERLQQALALTPAEARLVAKMFQGGSLGIVAKELGISPNTAKTQLASVFIKTGTRRQRELIALASALVRQHIA